MKKTRLTILALLLSCMMVFSASAININVKANDVSEAFTGGIAQTGNLFEKATISDANYIINQWDGNGDSLVTIGDYIATAANGSHVKVGEITQMPITTTDASKALSYSGARLTMDGTTTLEMGVVDLTDSRAEDVSPVIGFVPSLNFLGPKTKEEVTNPYLGIYYTFRSTVNPEKYFSIAMKESTTYKYASLGVGYNGTWTHYGQGFPNDPGTYWNIDDSDRTGYYAFRFDGSMITNTSGQCSTNTKRVWIADNVAADGGEAEYNYNYPVKIYYDYETSCFYQQAVEYTRRDKFGEKGLRVTADDGTHRYLLFNAAEGSMGKGYGASNKNSNGWEGFTEEEAKSVAVSVHVDWNPEYTGSHDILITDFAGEKVSTANADTLKANKGTSGLLKEFTSEDGTLTLSDGYSLNLSDNDIFTKLVSFEVYPDQMGRSKTVNNSGLYSVSFQLSDGTDTLQLNLTNFAEKDADGVTIVDYRNCYTVSVNGETKWAQNQTMTFTTGDFGFPSPYGFDKYVRYPSQILLDQYGVDDDAGVNETAKWYSSDVIRTDTNYTPMASYSIYYNSADNCLYVDAGSWVADRYTNHERADGVVVKRWKIADLSSTYGDKREAFEGFGDKELTFSMATTLVDGFDSVKIRVLEVDGQKLATDKDGNAIIDKVYAPENGLISSGMDVELPKPYTKEFLKTDRVELDSSEFTTEVTAPDGSVHTDITDNKFDFDQLGEYLVKYFVDGKVIGSTTLIPAVSIDGELVAITSFGLKGEIAKGDVLTLNDIALNCGGQLASLEGATITLSKDGTIVSTDANVDATWTSIALEKGTYEISVVGVNFAVNGSFTAKTRIKAEQTVANGMVKVNGVEHSAILLEGDNTIQVIASEGYELATFTIGGEDVTSQLVNGYYTYSATEVSDNVYYTATFTKLTYTITFVIDGEPVGTVAGVEFGTQFGDVNSPAIPEKEGYEILGWSIENSAEVKSDLTATAVYGLKKHTITFDTQGGSAMDEREYSADDPVTAFGEEPTKEGYDFAGWYVGETKFVFGELLTEDITLTAKWTAKKFTVTIVNGEFADTTMEVEYNSTVDETSFAKDGYTFGGLFTDKDCTNKYNGQKITGETTLYALWTKNENTSGGGCTGSASASSMLLGLVALASGVVIKRKNDKK